LAWDSEHAEFIFSSAGPSVMFAGRNVKQRLAEGTAFVMKNSTSLAKEGHWLPAFDIGPTTGQNIVEV